VPEEPTCTEVPSELRCVPPYYDLGFGGGGGRATTQGGAEVDSNGSSKGEGALGAPTAPPSAAPGAESGEEASAAGSGKKSDGGCQVGSGSAPGGAWLLALAGLAALSRRQRVSARG
jgi:MYXO-CTERM domain-containing protein